MDINGLDENGRSVLMTMILEAVQEEVSYNDESAGVESFPLSKEFLEELQDMIDRRGADPKITDTSGRNILHYLAELNLKTDCYGSGQTIKRRKIIKHMSTLQVLYIKAFVAYGVNPFAIDKEGDMPLSLALKSSCTEFARNYPAIHTLLDAMLASSPTLSKGIAQPKDKPSVLCKYGHQ